MSECVVRMEMPENCECCPMVYTADVQGYHWCAALEQEVEQGLSRPKECPILCQLPEGHGTLIDLESAAEGLSERYNSCHMTCGAVMQFLDGLPTIVPADTAERSET